MTTNTIPDPFWAKRHFQAKVTFTTGPLELDRRLRNGENLVLVDIRATEDYARGHLPGAISLPKDLWPTAVGLRKDRPNVLYGHSPLCHLAADAGVVLAGSGYPVLELDGGFEGWKAFKLEVEL